VRHKGASDTGAAGACQWRKWDRRGAGCKFPGDAVWEISRRGRLPNRPQPDETIFDFCPVGRLVILAAIVGSRDLAMETRDARRCFPGGRMFSDHPICQRVPAVIRHSSFVVPATLQMIQPR